MNDSGVRYVLELFVADHGAHAEQMTRAISLALERLLGPGRYEFTTIDVLEHPERAVSAKVFATPMIIRSIPAPSLRVLGDLDDTERVMALLEIGNADRS